VPPTLPRSTVSPAASMRARSVGLSGLCISDSARLVQAPVAARGEDAEEMSKARQSPRLATITWEGVTRDTTAVEPLVSTASLPPTHCSL
jgi:hypothetical protein